MAPKLTPPPPPHPLLTRSGVLWTLDSRGGSRCLLGHAANVTCPGCLPLLPCLTSGGGATVRRAAADAALGWAWTPPGVRGPALDLSGRFIADVELSSDPDLPGWDGAAEDSEHAAFLSYRCQGVTSHGYPKRALEHVLTTFAAHGCRVFPQVYDSDRSTLTREGGPEAYIRRSVRMYAALGFEKITPLLGLSAGPDIVRRWVRWCDKRRVAWHLWAADDLTNEHAWVCRLLRDRGAPRAS